MAFGKFNVVTGYEGPSLTYYNGQYFFYTDKLKDYPYGKADGTAGTFVTQSSNLNSGWHGTRRITTTNVDGRSIPNRHGTVITVTDSVAKILFGMQGFVQVMEHIGLEQMVGSRRTGSATGMTMV